MNDSQRGRVVLLGAAVALIGFLAVAAGVGLAADASGPATQGVQQSGYSGTSNLSDADTTLSGNGTNDTAGWSVSNAGDVNGDGVDDLLVGAPDNDSTARDAGAAYLFFGPIDRSEIAIAEANVTLTGVSGFDRAGYAVSTAGDLNDDGYADVVVGAPGNDSTGENAGAAYVVYGNESLPEARNLRTADRVVRGADAGDRAGWSVSNASDVNGSVGIVVGAPFADNETGAAYLVDNGTSRVVDLETDATARVTGESRGDMAGWSVSNAGDADDDGVRDVIVGANNWTATGSDRVRNETAAAGAAYLVSGDTNGDLNLSRAAVRLRGADSRDRAGFAVANAGDLNNDSVDDVIVGAPFADPNGTDAAGEAYVLFGDSDLDGQVSLDAANVTYTGEGPRDRAGYAVSAAGSGDVTCDGIDDALVGAPGNDTGGLDAGAAYVTAGAERLPAEKSLGDADAKVYGEGAGDAAGQAVSEAGDVDGDGFADVVVGAPLADNDTVQDAGAAYVLLNDCTQTPPTPPRDPVETNVDCTPDGGTLTVENANERAVRVVVTGPDGSERRVTVAAGDTATFTRLRDGDYRVRTYTPDDDPVKIGDETVEIECPTRQIEVERDCTRDGGELTLRNVEGEPKAVTVEGPNGFERTVTVPGDSERTLAGLADGEYTVRTRGASPGADYRLGQQSVTVDCPDLPPLDGVGTTFECTPDGGELTVENTNDRAATVVVEGPGDFERRVTLAAGGTRTFGDLGDGEYEVRTLDPERNGDRVATDTVRVACPTEPVNVERECSPAGGNLTVENPNEEAVAVIVDGPGGFRRPRVLDPGERARFTGLPDGDYTVTTRSNIAGNDYRIGKQDLTVACPTEPVEVETVCEGGDGTLRVTNPNEEPVQVDVEGPDGFERQVTVGAGATANLTNVSNGEYTVTTRSGIDDNDYRIGERTATVDCLPPLEGVQPRLDCRADGGALTLENPNERAVEVDVDGPGGFERQVTVDAGANTTLTGLPDGEYEVRTVDPNDTDAPPVANETATVACPTEPVDVSRVCEDGEGIISVNNPNNESVVVVIEGPDGFERERTVEGNRGYSALGLDADGNYTVTTYASADKDVQLGQEEVEIDCAEPLEGIETTVECSADGGVLTVENPNNRTVEVEVDGPGGTETATLDPGENATVDGLDDGDYTVRTFDPEADGGDPVAEASVEIACPTEQVTVETVCEGGQGGIRVSNPNDEAVQVDVSGPGEYERRVTVEAGENETFPGLDNGEYTVVTLSAIDENVYRIGERTATVDCQPADPLAEVEISQSCTETGADLRITNPNDEAVRVLIEGPEGYAVNTAVAADATETVSGLPDGEFTIETIPNESGRNDPVGQQSFSVDCPTQSLQVSQVCEDGEGIISVNNPNEEPVRAVFSGPDGFERERTVEGNRGYSALGLDEGTYTVVTTAAIDGNEYEIGRETVEVECEEPDTPNTETPDTETPDTDTPDTETPDTDTPDTETPDTETPDTDTPEFPEPPVPPQPPEPPVPPQTPEEPETPEGPDTEESETDTPEPETEEPEPETDTPEPEPETDTPEPDEDDNAMLPDDGGAGNVALDESDVASTALWELASLLGAAGIALTGLLPGRE